MISVLSTNAVRAVLSDLLPGYEAQGGERVSVTWSTTKQTLERIKNGESGDLVIATAEGIDGLEREGKVVAGSRSDLGSSGIGLAVRRGGRKPRINSPDAFRRALLEAKSVAWTTMGASGVHFEGLLERLQIAREVRAKAVLVEGGLIGELLVRDEAELGIQMVSEILAVPGAELVAPLPDELQKTVLFSTAVMSKAKNAEGARALARYLASPAAARVMQQRGFERA